MLLVLKPDPMRNLKAAEEVPVTRVDPPTVMDVLLALKAPVALGVGVAVGVCVAAAVILGSSLLLLSTLGLFADHALCTMRNKLHRRPEHPDDRCNSDDEQIENYRPSRMSF